MTIDRWNTIDDKVRTGRNSKRKDDDAMDTQFRLSRRGMFLFNMTYIRGFITKKLIESFDSAVRGKSGDGIGAKVCRAIVVVSETCKVVG